MSAVLPGASMGVLSVSVQVCLCRRVRRLVCYDTVTAQQCKEQKETLA
jgi:hypothetical protein